MQLRVQLVVASAALLFSAFAVAQQPASPSLPPDQALSALQPAEKIEPAIHKIKNKERRRATKLYLEATRLFQKQQYEAAMKDYNEAARLDPENPNYAAATEVVRSHAVTELIQLATKARIKGDATAERAALQRAAELDPRNLQVVEHLREMADEASASQTKPLYEQGTESLAPAPTLEPIAGKKSFHFRTDRRQALQNVFHSFGIEASIDSSVTGPPVRFEMDDATFAQAMDAINVVTDTFTVPLDAHRAIVAKDTRENRIQYMRQELETVYLGGMTQAEMTDVGNMAKAIFQAQQTAVQLNAGTLTIRATTDRLNAFNETLKQLLAGKSQVLLDVKLLQVVHNNLKSTGIVPPQQITAFNVYAEEQAILSQNQQLVQEIISSGLASPGDTLTILGILLASGQVSSSIFQNGIALFGGGLTLSGLSPGPAKVNLNLNSSESRELDQLQIHLGDGEEGTIKTGSRYPIETSQYSDLGTSGINIPGLTSAGTSGSLSSLLSQLNSGGQTIPQIEYQDLGLTFKATPRVIRSGEVALTMDLKITALGGTSINGVPILNNRSYSGVATVKDNAAVVLVSQVDKEESRALSGLPGVTEIPGLNNITDKEVIKNYASLLIVISPHVIRGTQPGGHTPMVRIERGRAAM
ncbi:MAG: tetratricopeptide repeat protein [Acidobacteria bacterium]|nr:tetratricopeptide repeat protein [Acidobacteriota bacterium]